MFNVFEPKLVDSLLYAMIEFFNHGILRSQLSFEPHPFIRPPSRSRVYLCPFRGLVNDINDIHNYLHLCSYITLIYHRVILETIILILIQYIIVRNQFVYSVGKQSCVWKQLLVVLVCTKYYDQNAWVRTLDLWRFRPILTRCATETHIKHLIPTLSHNDRT